MQQHHQQLIMVTSFGLYSGHHQTTHYLEFKKKMFSRLSVNIGRDLIPLTKLYKTR
jgi:hypothetical protein